MPIGIRIDNVTTAAVVASALGAGFGAATSLSNGLVSPFDRGAVATGIRIVSLLVDAGWAWAALAVLAGWLAGTPMRGMLAGFLALGAATTAYYAMDSVLRHEPFAWYVPELLRWSLASVILGSACGCIGANARRSGFLGLAARLAVPVGATVQMLVMPPGAAPPATTSGADWARAIVMTGAVAAGAVATGRFILAQRRGTMAPASSSD